VLASPMGIHSMMTEIQDVYAALYGNELSLCVSTPFTRTYFSLLLPVRDDKKKAMRVLRTGDRAKSHHLSTSRSGFFLGISLLALVSGIYHSKFRHLFYSPFLT
jgi:hypothetical protein